MLDAPHEDPASSAAPLQGVQEDRQAHVSWWLLLRAGSTWVGLELQACFKPVYIWAFSSSLNSFFLPLSLPGTTASTWRPRVMCLRTSASWWSTFTSWRQTRPARSSWRKFNMHEKSSEFYRSRWGSDGRLNSPCSVSQRSGWSSSFKDKRGTQAQRGASPGQEGGDHQELVQGGGCTQEVTWICRPLQPLKCWQ